MAKIYALKGGFVTLSRPLRITFSNALYHVMARGLDGRDIYTDGREYRHFEELLKEASETFSIDYYAYCLMPNHYHLFLCTGKANLPQFMQWLNASYSIWFNHRHDRRGHFFQGRYKAVVVEGDAYFSEVSRYIHLNPVRKRLVEHPEEWRWSSYRGYIDERHQVRWIKYEGILQNVHTDTKRARRYYRDFIESAIGQELKRPWDDAVYDLVLGSKEYAEKIIQSAGKAIQTSDVDLPSLKQVRRRFTIEDVVKAVAKAANVQPSDIIETRWQRDSTDARRTAIYLCRKYTMRSLREIGETFGLRSSGVNYVLKQMNTEIPLLKQAIHLLEQQGDEAAR